MPETNTGVEIWVTAIRTFMDVRLVFFVVEGRVGTLVGVLCQSFETHGVTVEVGNIGTFQLLAMVG